MDESIIMLIVVGVLIIALAIAFASSKKKGKKDNTTGTSNSSKTSSNSNKSDGKQMPRKDMSEFITFDKIANDMIYQQKGEKYTMVIQCKGINYDLMSSIEQMSVEEGFIKFLNTLRTPIQLYVQTRTVNLAENINKYKERTAAFNDTYAEFASKYNAAEEDIDVSREDTEALRFEKIKYGNIAEYASDITKYVEKMSMNKFMLQRNYYIIISYYKSELVTTEKFSKQEYEELCYRELYTRAQGIISSLSTCAVTGRILKSNELAELIYISYNRDDQRTLDIKSALESGFYRLYSTSEDVRIKKQEMLDEEIRREAAARVEAAIQEGLKNGTLLTPEQAQAQMDKAIDKEAINIVNEAEVSKKTKELVKDQILKNRKERIENAKDQKQKEKQEMKDDRLDENSNTLDVEESNTKTMDQPQVIVENKKEEVKSEQHENEVKEEKMEKLEEVRVEENEKQNDIKNDEKEEFKQEIKNDSQNSVVVGLGDREEEFGSMNDEIDSRNDMSSNGSETKESEKQLVDDNSLDNTKTKANKTVDESEDDSIV